MNRLLTIVGSKYQRLEYLESTGTQYIDTGIVYDNSKTYEIMQDIVMTELVENSGSGWNAGGAIASYGPVWSDGSNRTDFYTTSRVQVDIKINSGTSSLTESSFKRISDGEVQTTSRSHSSLGTYAGTTGYPLFCMTDTGGTVPYALTKAKIYASQIKVDGVLVRKYVPVLRKTDNELGMLDLVEGKFYPNAGTGKFTANLDTMYAIIQGSPTQSPYGVFSGFSGSNYLSLQQNFAPEGSWEVCIKIKTGATTTSPVRYFFGCWGIGNIVIGTTTGTYFKAFISTNNGSSYNVTLTTTSAVSTETVYYVKLGFTGTKYYLEQSTDGVNFVGRAEYSSSAKISSYPVNFGKVYANDNIWNGEVDLNRSYIKIDNTKYKLQAVVGYTVVGSPTITDGVVSGFSSANYLQCLPNLPKNSERPFTDGSVYLNETYVKVDNKLWFNGQPS